MARRNIYCSLVFSAALFILSGSCFAAGILETEALLLSFDAYLRHDLAIFKNVADLDSSISDDTTAYTGLDYNLALTLRLKESDTLVYLKAERNGPYDYSAPLFVHNTLANSGGRIEAYRRDELLPELEEFWIDLPLQRSSRLKAGLYLYEVGNGFALNGGYENYGLSYTLKSGDLFLRFYYCRPDLRNKNRLGPRVRQDKEQGIDYNHGAENFFAADLKYETDGGYLWPYIGVLSDHTSDGKRDNLFASPVKKDLLGTVGMAWRLAGQRCSFSLECARNFGKAESSDPGFKDVEHSGYLAYAGAEYYAGKLTPSLKFLCASGNKSSEESAAAADTLLLSSKNRAFSYYSPLNGNLGDSISSSNVDMLPIVAMGGGYGLNYGVPRPGTFSAGDFDNLLMPCIGADYAACQRLDISLYFYYLRSFARPVGMREGEGVYLSRDLGWEADLLIDYKLNSRLTLEFLAGYFLPGRFYRAVRDDTSGSILSPYVRGDGKADNAYQVELCLAFKF